MIFQSAYGLSSEWLWKMNNSILVDFDASEKWEFLDAIKTATGEEWIVEKSISNRNHGGKFQKLIRYIKYFSMPFRTFLHRKEYSQVIAWQQFYGLILAFYFRLFRAKHTPDITVMTFIYKPKTLPIIGWLYDKFVRYCVTSEYINKIIVFSEKEKMYYASLLDVQEEKFSSVRLGIEDTRDKIPTHKNKKGSYFLSAGRSNRDYSFLLSAWGDDRQLKIVCDDLMAISGKTNIEILQDCHGDAYLDLLSKCYAVVIPLSDVHVSSGQLVILQSLMYGKPVIVTENDTVYDYVVSGEDGYIIPKTEIELKTALNLIEENYEELSSNASKHFKEKFSLYAMGTSIGKIIKS